MKSHKNNTVIKARPQGGGSWCWRKQHSWLCPCLAPKKCSVNSRDGDGREVRKGGDICIPMADSCWGVTENKILDSNYPSIKNKKELELLACIVFVWTVCPLEQLGALIFLSWFSFWQGVSWRRAPTTLLGTNFPGAQVQMDPPFLARATHPVLRGEKSRRRGPLPRHVHNSFQFHSAWLWLLFLDIPPLWLLPLLLLLLLTLWRSVSGESGHCKLSSLRSGLNISVMLSGWTLVSPITWDFMAYGNYCTHSNHLSRRQWGSFPLQSSLEKIPAQYTCRVHSLPHVQLITWIQPSSLYTSHQDRSTGACGSTPADSTSSDHIVLRCVFVEKICTLRVGAVQTCVIQGSTVLTKCPRYNLNCWGKWERQPRKANRSHLFLRAQGLE